jgi:diguanylate cyclase (GGDEF)-like protein/putative nucleotidyltransferase with HDIG domain
MPDVLCSTFAHSGSRQLAKWRTNAYNRLDRLAPAAPISRFGHGCVCTSWPFGFMPPKTFSTLPRATQAYITVIVLAGAATVLQSTYDLATGNIGWNWTILAVLTLLSGSATVSLPSLPATVSVSETFVFTSAILFGPSAGTMTVALDAAVISFWSYRRGQPVFKVLFNVCALPLTIWIASHLFFATVSFQPLFQNPDKVGIKDLLWPLVLFTVVYFSLNSWIITFAISFERRLPAFKIWRDNFVPLSLNYFGGASVAALLVSYTKDLDYTYLAVIVPLLIVLYFTFATSMGRVEDANRHLTDMNALYMSTIETLAMAIDAKDQITHGHIRRVQTFAIGLAKEIGVKDLALIRAIEAAALLHDMGKLAVPEYILNKPGPLTPAEFEKMKLHASVGADILSSINFPYPVVPIVRHHHESWDGSGYPDGLRGAEIPIGARILSVVDCFDALTSDRPYRPRLSDNEAVRILLERRGKMYDPLIVDTFIASYAEIAPIDTDESASQKVGFSAIVRSTAAVTDDSTTRTGLDDIAASTEEMLVLYDLARALTGRFTLADAADIISKHLRRIVPASTCVFYVYDNDKDELVAAHSSGESSAHFAGLRIPRGQRLTGWVAANKQTIVNSDPVLDMGESARSLKPRLRSCLGTPLLNGQQLVGVLTVYSTSAEAFSDDHRRVLEVVARQVSLTVKHASDFEQNEHSDSRDQLTGLPNLKVLDRFVSSEMNLPAGNSILSIVVIDVPTLSSSTRRASRVSDERALFEAASAIRQALRGADVLFRFGADQFIVLLTQTDSAAATLVASRIAERLRTFQDEHGGTGASMLGIATAPSDGVTLEALIAAARNRYEPVDRVAIPKHPSIH